MSRDGKKQAYRFGRWAELLCVWRLRLNGYRILERDYRQSTGEIDIIAKRGQVLAFIEVKARDTSQNAAYALGSTQRRRIEKTAMIFIAQASQYSSCDNRFDLMLVNPGGWPKHIPAAWMLGE